MKVPTAVRWTGLALLGVLVAAAVSVAASRLASQQIGLASEPISAGDALAPSQRQLHPSAAPKSGSGGHSKHTRPSPPSGTPEQSSAEPLPTPRAPSEATEPSYPHGDGEHGDGGADD